MPSQKREEKKKSHHKKKKKYSRSKKKKKSRGDKNHGKRNVSEIDISISVNNPSEMISRVFKCLGESYIMQSTPNIFKSLKLLELKKLCLRELTKLPSETVISIMNGLSPENADSLAEHSGTSSPHGNSQVSLHSKKQKKRKKHHSKRKETSSDSSSESSVESSCDTTSTSSGHALSSSADDTSAENSSDSEERDDSQQRVKPPNVPEGSQSRDKSSRNLPKEQGDDNQNRGSSPKINVPFLQPVPEVTELEYRARAIRSMIANIDKINEKSFERNSI